MFVGILQVDLHLDKAASLKDKRQVVKSVLARVRAAFNVSAAEPGFGATPNHFSLSFARVPSSFMHSIAFSTLLRSAALSLRNGIEKTRPVECR